MRLDASCRDLGRLAVALGCALAIGTVAAGEKIRFSGKGGLSGPGSLVQPEKPRFDAPDFMDVTKSKPNAGETLDLQIMQQQQQEIMAAEARDRQRGKDDRGLWSDDRRTDKSGRTAGEREREAWIEGRESGREGRLEWSDRKGWGDAGGETNRTGGATNRFEMQARQLNALYSTNSTDAAYGDEPREGGFPGESRSRESQAMMPGLEQRNGLLKLEFTGPRGGELAPGEVGIKQGLSFGRQGFERDARSLPSYMQRRGPPALVETSKPDLTSGNTGPGLGNPGMRTQPLNAPGIAPGIQGSAPLIEPKAQPRFEPLPSTLEIPKRRI